MTREETPWTFCCICGDPVPEDWSDFCSDCANIPGRRVVWGRLNEEEQQKWWNRDEYGPLKYGWTYTWKNWTWVPIGDGSGLGVVVKKPATEEKIQAALRATDHSPCLT